MNIINPYYAINDRMCTLEDLFVQYQNLKLNSGAYYLYAPDKDYCPSITELSNTDLKVYYIEKDILDAMNNMSSTVKLGITTCKDNMFATPPNITYSSELGGTVSISPVARTNEKMETNWSYQNFWYPYVNKEYFESIIKQYLNIYFTSTENTDDEDLALLDMLNARLDNTTYGFLTDKAALENPKNQIWEEAADILVSFINEILSSIKYKDNYLFYSSKCTVIYPLQLLYKFWIYIDNSLAEPNYKSCTLNMEVGSDAVGYYIYDTNNHNIKKYVHQARFRVEKYHVSTYYEPITIQDIYEIFNVLREYVVKNYIYLPYHIPLLGVSMDNGSQQYSSNTNMHNYTNSNFCLYMLVRQCDVLQGALSVYLPYNNCINVPFNRSYYNNSKEINTVISDIINQYKGNIYTRNADVFYDAEFDINAYTTICKIDDSKDGDPDFEISKNVSYTYISNEDLTKTHTYLFLPTNNNNTSHIIDYTYSITHKESNIMYTYTLYQYPASFIVYCQTMPLSNEDYKYSILDFSITSTNIAYKNLTNFDNIHQRNDVYKEITFNSSTEIKENYANLPCYSPLTYKNIPYDTITNTTLTYYYNNIFQEIPKSQLKQSFDNVIDEEEDNDNLIYIPETYAPVSIADIDNDKSITYYKPLKYTGIKAYNDKFDLSKVYYILSFNKKYIPVTARDIGLVDNSLFNILDTLYLPETYAAISNLEDLDALIVYEYTNNDYNPLKIADAKEGNTYYIPSTYKEVRYTSNNFKPDNTYYDVKYNEIGDLKAIWRNIKNGQTFYNTMLLYAVSDLDEYKPVHGKEYIFGKIYYYDQIIDEYSPTTASLYSNIDESIITYSYSDVSDDEPIIYGAEAPATSTYIPILYNNINEFSDTSIFYEKLDPTYKEVVFKNPEFDTEAIYFKKTPETYTLVYGSTTTADKVGNTETYYYFNTSTLINKTDRRYNETYYYNDQSVLKKYIHGIDPSTNKSTYKIDWREYDQLVGSTAEIGHNIYSKTEDLYDSSITIASTDFDISTYYYKPTDFKSVNEYIEETGLSGTSTIIKEGTVIYSYNEASDEYTPNVIESKNEKEELESDIENVYIPIDYEPIKYISNDIKPDTPYYTRTYIAVKYLTSYYEEIKNGINVYESQSSEKLISTIKDGFNINKTYYYDNGTGRATICAINNNFDLTKTYFIGSDYEAITYYNPDIDITKYYYTSQSSNAAVLFDKKEMFGKNVNKIYAPITYKQIQGISCSKDILYYELKNNEYIPIWQNSNNFKSSNYYYYPYTYESISVANTNFKLGIQYYLPATYDAIDFTDINAYPAYYVKTISDDTYLPIKYKDIINTTIMYYLPETYKLVSQSKLETNTVYYYKEYEYTKIDYNKLTENTTYYIGEENDYKPIIYNDSIDPYITYYKAEDDYVKVNFEDIDRDNPENYTYKGIDKTCQVIIQDADKFAENSNKNVNLYIPDSYVSIQKRYMDQALYYYEPDIYKQIKYQDIDINANMHYYEPSTYKEFHGEVDSNIIYYYPETYDASNDINTYILCQQGLTYVYEASTYKEIDYAHINDTYKVLYEPSVYKYVKYEDLVEETTYYEPDIYMLFKNFTKFSTDNLYYEPSTYRQVTDFKQNVSIYYEPSTYSIINIYDIHSSFVYEPDTYKYIEPENIVSNNIYYSGSSYKYGYYKDLKTLGKPLFIPDTYSLKQYGELEKASLKLYNDPTKDSIVYVTTYVPIHKNDLQNGDVYFEGKNYKYAGNVYTEDTIVYIPTGFKSITYANITNLSDIYYIKIDGKYQYTTLRGDYYKPIAYKIVPHASIEQHAYYYTYNASNKSYSIISVDKIDKSITYYTPSDYTNMSLEEFQKLKENDPYYICDIDHETSDNGTEYTIEIYQLQRAVPLYEPDAFAEVRGGDLTNNMINDDYSNLNGATIENIPIYKPSIYVPFVYYDTDNIDDIKYYYIESTEFKPIVFDVNSDINMNYYIPDTYKYIGDKILNNMDICYIHDSYKPINVLYAPQYVESGDTIYGDEIYYEPSTYKKVESSNLIDTSIYYYPNEFIKKGKYTASMAGGIYYTPDTYKQLDPSSYEDLQSYKTYIQKQTSNNEIYEPSTYKQIIYEDIKNTTIYYYEPSMYKEIQYANIKQNFTYYIPDTYVKIALKNGDNENITHKIKYYYIPLTYTYKEEVDDNLCKYEPSTYKTIEYKDIIDIDQPYYEPSTYKGISPTEIHGEDSLYYQPNTFIDISVYDENISIYYKDSKQLPIMYKEKDDEKEYIFEPNTQYYIKTQKYKSYKFIELIKDSTNISGTTQLYYIPYISLTYDELKNKYKNYYVIMQSLDDSNKTIDITVNYTVFDLNTNTYVTKDQLSNIPKNRSCNFQVYFYQITDYTYKGNKSIDIYTNNAKNTNICYMAGTSIVKQDTYFNTQLTNANSEVGRSVGTRTLDKVPNTVAQNSWLYYASGDKYKVKLTMQFSEM